MSRDNTSTIGPLGWILLYVDDLDRMGRFYRDVVGLEVTDSTDGVFVRFATNACHLELMAHPHSDSSARGWDRNRFLISFPVPDLDREIRRLEEAGVPQTGPTKLIVGVEDPEWRVAQFSDPEGNLFEITDIPRPDLRDD